MCKLNTNSSILQVIMQNLVGAISSNIMNICWSRNATHALELFLHANKIHLVKKTVWINQMKSTRLQCPALVEYNACCNDRQGAT